MCHHGRVLVRDRYQVIRRLGAGGAGSVYEVVNVAGGGARQALKALWPGARDAGLVEALRAEFGVLATIHHPRLCRVFDFGRLPADAALDGAPESAGRGGYFLTRELVDGVPLGDRAAAVGRDLGQVCRLLCEAARGLEVLHAAGMRHGDFKPANAIAAPAGTVRLIDFGLAVEEGVQRSAGTLAYMAPEILTQRAVDRRADLYALGVSLFELVTGLLPSGDRRGAELIAWHTGGARPRLSAHLPVPDALDRLCDRLVASAPDDRLPTAAEAAAALEACARELGADAVDGPEHLALPALPMPAVAALERAFERRRWRKGGSALALITGRAGSGRSAALTELAWRAQLAGAEVVRGRPVAAGRPLGVFGAAADELAALTGTPPPTADGDGPGHLARVAHWLAAAADRFPVVILLDDLDFADEATRRLASYLAFGLPDEARVLIAAARRADGDRSRAAARVGEVPTFPLAPLTAGDVGALLARVAGRRDDRLAARVTAHTGGNLLHVVHALEALARRGFATAESLDALGLPPRLEEDLAGALDGAGDDERALCEALAVLGRAAPPAVVGAMIDRVEADLIAVASASPLAAFDPTGRLLLERPGVRQAIAGALPPERQRALHAAAAAALVDRERLAADDPEVVTHLVRAGDRDGARARVPAALAKLRRAGDSAGAVELGRAAATLLGADCPPALALAIGDVARAMGDAAVAAAVLGPLAAAPVDAPHAARARYLLGCALEEAGDPDAATALWREVIDGQPAGADAALAARELSRLHLKRGRTDAALAVAEAALAHVRDVAVREHLEVARAFARGSQGAATDPDQAAAAAGELERAAARATERGDELLAATAFNYAALISFRAADYRITRVRYQRALEAARRGGDLVREATLRMNLASLAFHQGDYAGCLEQHVAAVSLLRAAGADTALVMARRNLGHLFVELGEYEQARAELRAARAIADELGLAVQVAGCEALLGIADARTGDARAGLARLERARAGYEALDDQTRAVETQLDIAEIALESGDLARAGDAADAIQDRVGGSGLSRRARAAAVRAELSARSGDADGARAALAELDPLIDELREQRAVHALWNLHAAAARARAACGDDPLPHRRAAAALLDEMAAPLPDAHRAAFWHDPRRRALRGGEPSSELGSTRTDPAPLAAALESERLHRLLSIYRRMSGERDFDRLLAMVMDTAVELSGAERGFLLLADGGGGLRTAVARNLPPATLRALAEVDADPTRSSLHLVPYSRTIAERVFHDGEVILSNEPQSDPRFDAAQSVHALELESVVCLPVSSGAEVVGVLYLESRVRRACFSDGDLQLLLAFADQVAILVGNARLLDENARRARELERAQAEISALLAERTELLAERTQELAHARRDLAAVRRRFLGEGGAFGLIGRSPAMERVFELIERLAATDVPVTILGESGTGKELVARALHEFGPRKEAPMVSVNCGALPEPLLESELFGHVRGAFTGAERDRRGLFETASGGTLFLDEIGDTPPRMQATLLRALQEKVIRRVGGTEDIRVDVRVVAATNRDLEAMVADGSFRRDLYYRLDVVSIHVPALRERADDIPLLAEHFLRLACDRAGLSPRQLSGDALRALADCPWPGNVRQLEHAITNAAVMADGDVIGAEAFRAVLDGPSAVRSEPAGARERARLRERERILEALEATGWNKSKAARMLQIPRRTFYRRLDEYEIQ